MVARGAGAAGPPSITTFRQSMIASSPSSEDPKFCPYRVKFIVLFFAFAFPSGTCFTLALVTTGGRYAKFTGRILPRHMQASN